MTATTDKDRRRSHVQIPPGSYALRKRGTDDSAITDSFVPGGGDFPRGFKGPPFGKCAGSLGAGGTLWRRALAQLRLLAISAEHAGSQLRGAAKLSRAAKLPRTAKLPRAAKLRSAAKRCGEHVGRSPARRPNGRATGGRARLFMQQGRTAPAQRIYLELQPAASFVRRRSRRPRRPRSITSRPPVLHPTDPQPNGPTSAAAWGQAAPGYATNQRQVAPSHFPSAQFPPAFQAYQPTPQFQASAQAAPGGESSAQPGANSQPAIDTQPAPNPPVNPNTQTVDNENFSPQALQSPAAAPTPSAGYRSSPVPEVTVSVIAAPPVMVLDRPQATSRTTPPSAAATVTTTAVEHSSNGWRAAITPLPAALAQTTPPNAGQANLTSTSTVPVSSTQPSATPTTNTIPANGETSAISTAHPLEFAREPRQAADELPNFHTQPLPDLPPRTPPSATALTSTGAPKPFDQEPPAFNLPGSNRERRLAPAESTDPPEAPGVVSLPSAPPPVDLSPRQVPRTVPLATERETSNAILDQAAKLAKQTDDIRIIPGNRGNGYSRLETLLNVEGKNAATPPDSAFDIPTSGWKSTIPSGPPATNINSGPSSASRQNRHV